MRRKEVNNEETTCDRVGGEGDSSCAHGIFDGDRNDQLHGKWTYLVLNSPKLSIRIEESHFYRVALLIIDFFATAEAVHYLAVIPQIDVPL